MATNPRKVLLASMVLVCAGLASAQSPATPASGLGALTLNAPWTAPETLIVQLLRFQNQPMAKLRWEVSVSAARARAAAQGKPIFMVVNTGHCLGYV